MECWRNPDDIDIINVPILQMKKRRCAGFSTFMSKIIKQYKRQSQDCNVTPVKPNFMLAKNFLYYKSLSIFGFLISYI